MLLQFIVIVFMSVTASYAFQHTETMYQINGLCFYRYLAYISAIFLGYVCFSQYKKYIALAFSFVLSVVALSPIGQKALELFPSAVPLLAVLMGVTAILIVPSSRGRGFSEFLVLLVLPAILAESRIGGSVRLIATTQSISYNEASVIAVVIVGGYFYLRYATLASLRCSEFLSSDADEKDVAKVSKQCNSMATLVVIGASGISVFLMTSAPVVADALRATVVALPLLVLALATGVGITITIILYIFQRSHKETAQARFR